MTPTKTTTDKLPIKIISLNARGLNIPERRSQLLLTMQRSKADIIFLQETHFRTDAIPKLQNQYYPTTFHATSQTSKSKGVSILLSKHWPLQLTDTLTDVEGRYLFIKGVLFGKKITFANIYAPNSHQVKFFRDITSALLTFQEGILILGGDLNVPLNPIQDTSTGTSSLPYAALKAIKSQLQLLLLHDSWRFLNPNGRDYTFFSAPHNKYSRIDYMFITQNDLTILQHASIDPIFLSDHHPISMTIAFPEIHPRPQHWKLDPSLLTDPAMLAEVELHIKQYFAENKPTDTSPLITWEAHKCVIRGILIAAASRRRKEKKQHLLGLLNRIKTLENAHKRSQVLTTLQPLLQARNELLELLGKQIKRKYILSQRVFYEYSNKAGRLLARALQAKKTTTTVHSLTDFKGRKLTTTPDIAEHFVTYYSQLYNLPPACSPTEVDSRQQAIRDFLQQYSPAPISTSLVQQLNDPLP